MTILAMCLLALGIARFGQLAVKDWPALLLLWSGWMILFVQEVTA
jgi:hypothetical protein